MKIFSQVLIALVAMEHIYFLWIEMFAWTTAGKKTFKSFPPDLFEKTKKLAANQGLYNGFLSAGLFWSILIADPAWSFNTACFFLLCVITAGIYGGLTTARSIFIVQGIPALLALLVTLLS